MNGCKLTKVFRFNNEQLVIGDSIEEAIAVYRQYYKDEFVEIRRIDAVHGDSLGLNDSALCLEKEK